MMCTGRFKVKHHSISGANKCQKWALTELLLVLVIWPALTQVFTGMVNGKSLEGAEQDDNLFPSGPINRQL